jgi:TetR/AcrR family transcriptional repressor of nem operon
MEFGSKEGLFQECINNFVLETKKDLKNILTRPPLGMKNIETFFRNRIVYASSDDCIGCLLINTAIEKELLEAEAFELAQKHIFDYENLFYRCLEAAKADGDIPEDKDCRILAKYLMNFLAGLMVIGKTKQKLESLETLLEMTFATIKN